MTSKFKLYDSARLETLADYYWQARNRCPADYRSGNVMRPENLTVANRGMWLWLEQYLVKHGEVVANFEAPFINNQLNRIIMQFQGHRPGCRPDLFTDKVLLWRIYRRLSDPQLLAHPAMAPIKLYIGESSNAPVRTFQLSGKLARLYYNYCAYLPEQLASAQHDGDSGNWQRILWDALKTENGTPLLTPPQLMLDFIYGRECQIPPRDELLPVTLFGISAIPPIFLRVLGVYAQYAPVNFFYLNPSSEDWSEQRPERMLTIDELRERHDTPELNNTLLAAFGGQGREFFKALLDQEITAAQLGGGKCWHGSTPQNTLLGAVQSCIVNCTDVPLQQPSDDDSLTFHSCANAVRQVEVLHDCLLSLLEKSNSSPDAEPLHLNDIVVMTPDISAFAPAIRAVFGGGPLQNAYCISDRSLRQSNPVAAAFLAIVKIHSSRFEYSCITSLLSCDALRCRFGISDSDLETIRKWLAAAHINWGRNAQSRRSIPGGAFPDFSWEYGLDRLTLNLAMESDSAYDGLPPVPVACSTSSMQLLGALNTLLERLGALDDAIARNSERTVSQWHELLRNLIHDFFTATDESRRDCAMLNAAVEQWHEHTAAACGGDTGAATIPYPVLCEAMNTVLDSPAPSAPFLNGKITFCSLMPMRSVPCRVIALLGMDEGAFPREEERLNYNAVLHLRTAGQERRGRWLPPYACSSLAEDRYSFLEAILSARSNLLIFYCGMDEQNGKELPMAVPAAILFDYAGQLCGSPVKCIHHRLNSTDPRNFLCTPAESSLHDAFSYDHTSWAVAGDADTTPDDAAADSGAASPALTALGQQLYQSPAFDKALPGDQELILTTKELSSFLSSPADFFLKHAFGLPDRQWQEAPPQDTDPLSLDQHSSQRLRRKIGAAALRTENETDLDALGKRLQAEGELPRGRLGELYFRQLREECRFFTPPEHNFTTEALEISLPGLPQLPPESLRETLYCGFDLPAPVRPQLPCLTVRLCGSVEHLAGGGLWRCLFQPAGSTPKTAAMSEAYVDHLLLCSAQNKALKSLLLPSAGSPENKALNLGALCTAEEALGQLRALVTAYLTSRLLPLPVFYSLSQSLACRSCSEGAVKDAKTLLDAIAKATAQPPYSRLYRFTPESIFTATAPRAPVTLTPLGNAIYQCAYWCYGYLAANGEDAPQSPPESAKKRLSRHS